MSDQSDTSLKAVGQLAEEAITYVERALDFRLDGSDGTLSVLDHYLGTVPADEGSVCELTASVAGCYFGEILRAQYGGHWIIPAEPPATWRLELGVVEVSLYPVGMAWQAIMKGAQTEDYDDGVEVPVPDRGPLAEGLKHAFQVDEDAYYTLCNRYDTLEFIVDFLLRRAEAAAADPAEEPSAT